MAGEKTEQPTPQKLKKAKQEGQLQKSPDLGAWVGMLAASFLVPMVMETAVQKSRELLERVPKTIENPDLGTLGPLLRDAMIAVGIAVAPLALALLALGVGGAAAQGGIHVATKLFMPKFNRLNPWSGIKQKFGPHAWWEGVKALVKTIVLGAVLYYSIKDLLPQLVFSGQMPLANLLGTVSGAVTNLIRVASAAGLAMALADIIVVRRRTNKQLRMTKQEVKDEHKKSEGDPHVKGQIRARQLAMARNRMMADLPKADVIVVNPTHIAVALRYDPDKGAPKLIAKGADNLARKIREIGTENRIPLVQDVPLARALHAGCEIGQEIPPQFYGAVAKVLAFVMSLKAKGSAAGLHRPPPSVELGAAE
ncbi:flagellar biosynthesis protein FlhB [Pilimelia terevasa]|uniref:Flagellar biosynthesis protein FlhB n=1 Tax=Pilimelia terevasa TaxID=53372 RepID=A0A8J3FEZ1_9ACTN|nr:EscU/YscU/HrcU family type III secretion system export apparatus switch protein [Pilimelia terevasa]GGK18026.1 flagellar biosynthesis protein FlhB [Pilimelia terevasa]